MRILICTNSLGARGGIERVTIVKANALAEIEGNEVAICYTDRGTYPDDTIHPVSDKVQVYDLGVSFWDLFPLNLKNLLVTSTKKFLYLRRSLKKLIAEFKPDIVITTGSYEKFGLASIRMKRPCAKIREYHFSSNYRRYIGASKVIKIAGWFDNNILGRFFDKNYLLTKQDLEVNFKNNPRFDYMPNPCSFTGKPISDKPRDNVVIAVGRLVDLKNFAALLRIWSKLGAAADGWQLWIAGDGDQKNMLKDLAERLGITESVRFLGYRKDVNELLMQSKILAMTSKCEGFGLNIIEAMQCGTVSVAYATPYGPRDIITDGVDGIVVDYNDEAAFARRLALLMTDEDSINRMSANAIERAKAFDVDVITARWMDKYKALTGRQ